MRAQRTCELEIGARERDEIERVWPTVLRRVGGYNLDSWGRDGQFSMTRMAVGSEGTLVAVTEAKVRLVPRPQANALNVVHFDSVPASLDALVEILATKPASIELIDKMLLDMTREQLAAHWVTDVLDGLSRRRLDLAFVTLPTRDGPFESVALCRDPYTVVARRCDHIAAGTTVSMPERNCSPNVAGLNDSASQSA